MSISRNIRCAVVAAATIVFLIQYIRQLCIKYTDGIRACVRVCVCFCGCYFFALVPNKPKFLGFNVVFYFLFLSLGLAFTTSRNNCYVLLSIKMCSTTTIKVERICALTKHTLFTDNTIDNMKWSVHYNYYYHVCNTLCMYVVYTFEITRWKG